MYAFDSDGETADWAEPAKRTETIASRDFGPERKGAADPEGIAQLQGTTLSVEVWSKKLKMQSIKNIFFFRTNRHWQQTRHERRRDEDDPTRTEGKTTNTRKTWPNSNLANPKTTTKKHIVTVSFLAYKKRLFFYFGRRRNFISTD